MDSGLQQDTAVIREGDPSQPRPTKAEVKVDAAEATTTHEDKGKKVPNNAGKKMKKKKGTKKHSGGNGKKSQHGSKKGRRKDESSSGDSTSSSDDDADSSSSDSEDSALEVVTSRKRGTTKKGLDAHKLRLQTNKKKKPLSTKLQSAADSDVTSDWDSSDSASESEEDDEAVPVVTNKRSKNPSSSQDLSYHVARELQRLLQLAQTQPSSSAVLPGHLGLGAGLGGGLDPGLGGGLSALNYSQTGRGALGAHPALAAGRGRPGRPQPTRSALDDGSGSDPLLAGRGRWPGGSHDKKQPASSAEHSKKKSKKLDYKRVDQVWDNTIHNFKLQDTAQSNAETKYDGFCFHVRRTFDWEGKYKATVVDIKSKILRECLQDVIGNIKGVSLVDETPKLDPNVLFLYLEDLRKWTRQLKKRAAKPPGSDKQERKKEAKRLEEKRQQLKVLVKYIDKDYEHIKKSLYPMLEHGLITFDLLWALWKPNTLAYTTTYGSHDEPRIFKVDTAEKHYHISKGEFYYIDGKYFEYDGKQFGYGHMVEEIPEFRGAKKITSLGCYPLKYHKNEEKLRKDLIERGQKFVTLAGVHYKSHHGLAYYKKKKSVIKVNVNGRVMVDPSIHRRINPNYPISLVRPKENDLSSDDEESNDDDGCGCSDEENIGQDQELEDDDEKVKYVTKVYKDDKGRIQVVRLTKEDAEELDKEKLAKVESMDDAELEASGDEESDVKDTDTKKVPGFTDDEYLIASPVVLGFSFGEKLWLEFTVSGIKDISWNEKAYDSLVLEPKTKETVKVRHGSNFNTF